MNRLTVGRFNQLEAIKSAPQGLYLESSEGEILLPTRWVGDHRVGDVIDVFVHTDSEDRLIASTQAPKLQLGELALLRVTDTCSFGAFLDWGLPKELLCPNREQHHPLRVGDQAVVRLCMDDERGLLYGTTRLRPYLEPEDGSLEVGQSIEFMVLWPSDLGVSVCINHRYAGLIHHNDLHQHLSTGHQGQGWIKEVREDGGLGVMLKPRGYKGILEAKPRILAALQEHDGRLPYHDKSDPDLIQMHMGMSKKTYKKAVGGLLREGKITMDHKGIRLI